jgi:hypothetical protein
VFIYIWGFVPPNPWGGSESLCLANGQWIEGKVDKVPPVVRKIQFIMKTVMGQNEDFLYA